MSLNGIDVSSWQSALNIGAINADFVIIKATEGNYYVNPHCDIHYQQAKTSGKKLGVYHFADHGDAISEADYFVENISGYIGESILILDWEGNFTADVAWAKAWLDRVFEKTNVRPLIYMSASVVSAHDWSSVINANYGLWVAQYADSDVHYNYSITGSDSNVVWGATSNVLWQWTSTGRLDGYGANLDCNVFYGDQSAWDSYARPVVSAEPVQAPVDVPATIPVVETVPESPVSDTPSVPVVAVPAPAPVIDPTRFQQFIQFIIAVYRKLFRKGA